MISFLQTFSHYPLLGAFNFFMHRLPETYVDFFNKFFFAALLLFAASVLINCIAKKSYRINWWFFVFQEFQEFHFFPYILCERSHSVFLKFRDLSIQYLVLWSIMEYHELWAGGWLRNFWMVDVFLLILRQKCWINVLVMDIFMEIWKDTLMVSGNSGFVWYFFVYGQVFSYKNPEKSLNI